jgi:D(-)-tartrate dehydratase
LTGSEHLAVDAVNCFDAESSLVTASALAPFGLRWFEDMA